MEGTASEHKWWNRHHLGVELTVGLEWPFRLYGDARLWGFFFRLGPINASCFWSYHKWEDEDE